ncbi:hypothetical protein [Granulicella arctica]|uniref:hypothetical protein n=1 Tax=Granulicella arctica TaxID=940613 RepID=UPI0021DF7C8D|nr:hypothetical protein [Granulicella arctica]
MARDFLSGLIGRAFEQTPVLEKRRRSLFEPDSAGARLSGAWMESAQEAGAEEHPAEREPQEIYAERALKSHEGNESGAAAVNPAQPSVQRSERPRPSARVERQEVAVERPAPGALQPSVPAPRSQPVPALVERRVEHRVERQRTLVERHETRVEQQPKVPGPAKMPELMRAKATEARFSQEKPQTDATRAPRDTASPAPPKRAMQPAPPAPQAPRVPPRSRAVPAETTPALPNIQVTIGRIELRAPQSAPKPAVSRAAAPKLGLDDYLRQRGGVQ